MTARHLPSVRLAFLLLALAAACAHPAEQRAAELSSGVQRRDRERAVLSAWRPPGRQTCEVLDVPRVLPPPDALVDTARLGAPLRQGGAMSRRGYMLLSLKFDSAGAATRVRVIEPELPDSLGRAAELAVQRALRPQPVDAPFGVRLRIDFTPEPALRVGRSERCEPAARHALAAVMSGPPAVTGTTEQTATRWYTLQYEVRVGERGHALEVRLLTPLEDHELTEQGREMLWKMLWYPGLDDRVPTEMATVVTQRVKVMTFISR